MGDAQPISNPILKCTPFRNRKISIDTWLEKLFAFSIDSVSNQATATFHAIESAVTDSSNITSTEKDPPIQVDFQ